MNKNYLLTSLLSAALLLSGISFGQQLNTSKNSSSTASNKTKTNFTVKPFAPSFVENKGQFDPYDANFSNHDYTSPAYGGNIGNAVVLFNGNSVQFVENLPEKEEAEKGGHELPEKKIETYRQTLTFVNANPNATFFNGEKEAQYFTYSDPQIKNGTIKANGFKSIGIKNLYPGIDVLYSFKKEGGLKYSFVVYPGADASLIKLQWDGVDAIAKDHSGILHMSSDNGVYTDNAPTTFYADDESRIITSGFMVNDYSVSFSLSDYDHSKTIIIDPWIHNPNFATFNSAYDIQHDPFGNIYIYGGQTQYHLEKFTSLGLPIWTYNTTAAYYGDFTLDAVGNAYCVYGPWGDICVKIDPTGALVWTANNNPPSTEIYRIYPNPVNGLLTIMGMQFDNSSAVRPMVCSLDPVTGTYGPFSLFPNPLKGEDRCMSVDANGDAYGLTFSGVSATDIPATNILWKVDATNTTVNSVQDGYTLTESEPSNTDMNFSGFNGTALSSCAVFTYDGLTVKKWDKTTLALLGSVAIPGGIAYITGGLCTDSCGNVYVGGPDSIIEFDNNLNHMAAVATTGHVYDVNNGNVPGEILACGQAFFGSFSFPICTSSSSSISENINVVSCSHPLILRPTSTGASYLWSTGATSDSIIVNNPGTYWVHVIDATVCSQIVSIADTFNVSFATPPTVNIGPDHTVCGNGPEILNAANPGDTYLWNTSATTQTLSINTTGTYWVSVSNGGCSTIDSITVAFVATPTINLGPDTTICSNMTLTLNAANTGFNYLWNTGATTQTITVNSQGTYSVYVSQGVCNGSDTIIITVVNPPVVNIGPDSTICSNQIITLNAGNTGYNFSWSTGATTQSITANTTGTYWVHVSNAACAVNDTAIITVIQIPVVNLGLDSTLCVGESLIIDAGNVGYLYHWSTGATTETINVSTPGTYWVIVNQGLCASNDTVLIHFINPPVVNLGHDTAVCSPNTVPLNAGNAGNTYQWNTGQNTQNITAANPGLYWVVVNNGSCSRTDSIIVSVVTPPSLSTAFFADTNKGCSPLTIHLTNQSNGAITYHWDFGDHDTSNTISPTHTYLDSGLFTVKLIIINDTSTVCGTFVDSAVYVQYIAVARPVHVTSSFLASPITDCTPLTVNLTNTSTNGTSYTWYLGNNMVNSDSTHLQANFPNAGIYTITLITSSPNARCKNPTDTMRIQVTADSCNLDVPNVFSPNHDGLNDFFHLTAEGYSNYHLVIFNRWGQKVFESNDTENLWNGKIDNTGGDAPDGTYYYIFTANTFYKVPHIEKGYLTLIR